MDKQANKELAQGQRDLYMQGKISHADYYLWLAQFIGADSGDLPVSDDKLSKSTDMHLNDIPLSHWDSGDQTIRPKAYSKGLSWSLSESVCVLKALARERIKTTLKG